MPNPIQPVEGTTPDPGTSTQQPQQPPQQQTEGKTFTQAEVDALVSKRVSKAEKAVEKRLTQSTPAPTNTPSNPPTAVAPTATASDVNTQLAQLTARLDQAESDRAFAETVAGIGGDIEKLKTLRPMFNPSDPDAFISAVQSLDLAPKAVAKTEDSEDESGTPFRGPGAPSGPPNGVMDNDATKWSKDYIDRMRGDGTFIKELNKWADTLPGGSNGLFKRRIPKG